MGKNSGSHIFWTLTYDGTSYIGTWYCQQHAKWDQIEHIDQNTAMFNLQSHKNGPHGCVNQ